MLKDITLGQYFPGTSVIHKMDPRVKLVLALIYIVELFLVDSFYGFIVAGGLLVYVIAVSKVPVKTILRSLKPILFLIGFTALLNLFFTQGEVLWSWWVLKITKEGLLNAAKMMIRIALLVMGTSMLTYTTSPIMLTDAIERLLGPLKKLRVPVHELAMMMTIALRFIPTLIEETDKIISAQKARGADFESGNLLRRAKALMPVLVPLFVSAFRRADELAVAMEARCYHGGEGRTRLKVMKVAFRDWVAMAVSTLSVAAILLLNLI